MILKCGGVVVIILSSTGHLALSEDNFGCHNWGNEAVLASGG